jgi:hypothetical protein
VDLNIYFASDYEVIANNTAAKQLLQTISFDLRTKKQGKNLKAHQPMSFLVVLSPSPSLQTPDSLCFISIPENPHSCIPVQFQTIQTLCVPFQFPTIHVSVLRSCETDSIPSTILSRHHQRNQEQISESWSARHQKFETFTSVVQVELNELNLSKSIRRQRNTCGRQLTSSTIPPR